MNLFVNEWQMEKVGLLNGRFHRQTPTELLSWAVNVFGKGLALGTGFGPSGVVLCHMLAQINPTSTFFYLDTDLLFNETYQLRDQLEARLGIRFTRVHSGLALDEQARAYGDELWTQNTNLCCQLRKVIPLRRYLTGKTAWVTGVRRDQSPTRARAQLIEWNPNYSLLKLNPLVSWTEEDVWSYIREHDLPYNELHDRGYPSLGCVPCTRAVQAGEGIRDGRWADQQKLECGIHIVNGRIQRIKQ